MNAKQAAGMAAASVRALRHYEALGLIHPARDSKNDYREYTEADVARVRLIRAYRELQFSLEEIQSILDADRMARDRILERQIGRLETQKQKIENRIALARSMRAMGPERFGEIDYKTVDDQMLRFQSSLENNQEWQRRNEALCALTEEQSDRITEGLLERVAAIAQAEEQDVETTIQNLKIYMEENLYPATPEILKYYANAFGGDGLLAQAVEERAGEGAAKRLRERLDRQ